MCSRHAGHRTRLRRDSVEGDCLSSRPAPSVCDYYGELVSHVQIAIEEQVALANLADAEGS